MADDLQGMKIAILAADGVEQAELEQPRQAVEAAGAQTELLSLKSGEIQAVEGDINPTEKFPVDREVSGASAEDYDGSLIEAGLVKGRRITSWPSMRTDLRNAGAEVVDEEVVTDEGLVSSRGPEDLDAF